MLAEKNEYIAEAASTVYQLSQDERVRMECQAREDYYRTQLGIQRELKKLDELRKSKDKLQDSLVETKDKLEEATGKLEETTGKLEETEGRLKETEAERDALASQFEDLLAWAKEHGYEKGTGK